MPRAWMAALCLALAASNGPSAQALRPYSVDDMLALESFGQVAFDPREKVVVVERRRPYGTAADYTYGAFTSRLLSNVLATRLDRPGVLNPLFHQDPGAGYWIGDFSPSGAKLTVFRLANRRLDLGVVDMASRQVSWLPVSPDLPIAHPAPSWLDDNTLIVVAMSERRLPTILSLGSGIEDDLRSRWADQASGTNSSATVLRTSAMSPLTPTRAVVRIDLRSGNAETLMEGDVTDVAVSRRGFLAVASAVAPVVPSASAPLRQSFTPLRHVLDVILPGRRPLRVADDVLPANMKWAADGHDLSFVRTTGTDRNEARFQVADVGGGRVAVRTIPIAIEASVSQGSGLLARSAWGGRKLLVEGAAPKGGRRWFLANPDHPSKGVRMLGAGTLVAADGRTAWFLDRGALSRIDLDAPRPAAALQGVIASGTISLDPSSRGARLLYNPSDATTDVVVADGAGSSLRILADGRLGSTMPVQAGGKILAVSRRYAVTFAEDADGVGNLTLSSPGRPVLALAVVNRRLALRARPHVVELHAVLSDGRKHSCWLALPGMPSSDRAPPLVTLVYPGMINDAAPPGDLSPSAFRPMTAVPILLGQGFAVLIPGLPDVGDPAGRLERLASDATAGVDAAVATGLVDADRIAILGHSFGGYGALGIAALSSRYRAVVAADGPYDLTAVFGQMTGPDRMRAELGLPYVSGSAWAETGQAGLMRAPWQDPSRYVGSSPIYMLDRVHAPVLLSGGEMDYVSLNQAEEAFMGLARLGRDATLLRFWGEGHVLASPANIREYWSVLIAWLDDHMSSGAGRPEIPANGAGPPLVSPSPSSSPTPRKPRG